MNRASQSSLLAVCLVSCALARASTVQARRSGLAAAGCQGCHSGGQVPKVTISTEPAVFAPGDTVTASVTIQAANGGPAGLYLVADLGRFGSIAGQSTTQVSDTEITHSAPKAASAGNVVFQVHWTAPAQANSVYFETWALASNGNGSTSGDGAGHALTSVLFGCTGSPYYVDLDGDGYGDAAGTTLIKCAATPGFADRAGDCNDNNRDTFPGAPEQCNGKDDNCDARSDEGLATGSHTLYVDQDGDGYGVASASALTVSGCTTMSGYAALSGDCNDRDASVFPGAPEVCNLLDDNCDGRIDERVRPRCGIGWCERLSATCDAAACVPGAPTAEVCNGADDDCNGVVDDGSALCSASLVCRLGACVAAGGSTENGGAPGTSGRTAIAESGGASAVGGVSAGGALEGGARAVATGSHSNGGQSNTSGAAGSLASGEASAGGTATPAPERAPACSLQLRAPVSPGFAVEFAWLAALAVVLISRRRAFEGR